MRGSDGVGGGRQSPGSRHSSTVSPATELVYKLQVPSQHEQHVWLSRIWDDMQTYTMASPWALRHLDPCMEVVCASIDRTQTVANCNGEGSWLVAVRTSPHRAPLGGQPPHCLDEFKQLHEHVLELVSASFAPLSMPSSNHGLLGDKNEPKLVSYHVVVLAIAAIPQGGASARTAVGGTRADARALECDYVYDVSRMRAQMPVVVHCRIPMRACGHPAMEICQ